VPQCAGKTDLDATGSQRNQFCELDRELGSHDVVVAAQSACCGVNATFPLRTRRPVRR
jgi:hypothetical protein